MIKIVSIPDAVHQINLYPFSGPRYTCALETKLICFLAKKSRANILEVGCNSGVTTRELALNCLDKTILAVDCTSEDNQMIKEQQYEKPDESSFGRYVKDCSNVQLFNSKFSDFDLNGPSVGFAFIDGDHTYSVVKEDTEKILNYFLAQGFGTIVWHDYYLEGPEWVGVQKYIDEVFNNTDQIVEWYEGTCVVSLTI